MPVFMQLTWVLKALLSGGPPQAGCNFARLSAALRFEVSIGAWETTGLVDDVGGPAAGPFIGAVGGAFTPGQTLRSSLNSSLYIRQKEVPLLQRSTAALQCSANA